MAEAIAVAVHLENADVAIGHALEDLAVTWLRAAGFDLYTRKGIRYGLPALALLAAIAYLPRLIRRLRGGQAH